jgi:hypothetical protein
LKTARGNSSTLPLLKDFGGQPRCGNCPPGWSDRYLRSLFTAGALAVIRCAKIHGPRSAGMNISKRHVQLVNWQAEGDDNVFFQILEDLYMGNQQ